MVNHHVHESGTEFGISALLPKVISRFKAHMLVESRALVGIGHPLFKAAKTGRTLPIEEVLKHEFVSFSQASFGASLAYSGTGDGWSDDKFPWKVGLKTESVEVALRVIQSGFYLGYLPTDLVAQTEVMALEVSGCPYSSSTASFLLAKNSGELGWIARLFG